MNSIRCRIGMHKYYGRTQPTGNRALICARCGKRIECWAPRPPKQVPSAPPPPQGGELRTKGHELEQRLLYAHPAPADEAVRRDAERYQFLLSVIKAEVDGTAFSGPQMAFAELLRAASLPIAPSALEEMLDAAMAQQGGQE